MDADYSFGSARCFHIMIIILLLLLLLLSSSAKKQMSKLSLQDLKHVTPKYITREDSVELAHYEPPHLDLPCLQIQPFFFYIIFALQVIMLHNVFILLSSSYYYSPSANEGSLLYVSVTNPVCREIFLESLTSVYIEFECDSTIALKGPEK